MCPPPPPAYNTCQWNTNCTVTSPPSYANSEQSCATKCGSGVFNYNVDSFACACNVDCSAGSQFEYNSAVYVVNNTMSNNVRSVLL